MARHAWSKLAARRACAGLICLALGGGAQAADPDFSGKTITMVIPSSVGGNTDAIARVFGRYLPDQLPGKPSIVYQNIPGADGITGVNYFALQTKPDGLTSLAGSESNIDPSVIHNPATRYDSKTLQMYGGFPSPTALLILRRAALPQFTDATKKPAIMGDVSAERNTDQMAVWGPRYLGWNLRWVLGYAGTTDLVLAVKRGEIDMMITYGDALIGQFKNDPTFIFPAQTGESRNGRLVRSPRWPDAPVFSELVRPKLKEPAEVKAFEAWETIAQIGKWYALPPGTPPSIVAAYRRAFETIVASKGFIADASKILGADFTTATGESMQTTAVSAASIGEAELAYFDRLRQAVGIVTDKSSH